MDRDSIARQIGKVFFSSVVFLGFGETHVLDAKMNVRSGPWDRTVRVSRD